MAAMQVPMPKTYSVSYLDDTDEHINDVDCVLEVDLTESKQDVKLNTKISCVVNDRKYISGFNTQTISEDPPSCIKKEYLYDMMIYALTNEKVTLHQVGINKRLIFTITDDIMVSIDLIDVEFAKMQKEINTYKEKIKSLTNQLPNWECVLCNSIKTYIDPRCCCVHCGKIICIDCRGKIINNKQMICPYCTHVHSGPLTC